MDKIGHRKIESHTPNFRQWLRSRGEEDAGMALFFFSRLDSTAIFRRYEGRDPRHVARQEGRRLLSKSLRQIHAYYDAIESGEVVETVEYVPLDLTKEADRAYNRVQQKRLAREYGYL